MPLVTPLATVDTSCWHASYHFKMTNTTVEYICPNATIKIQSLLYSNTVFIQQLDKQDTLCHPKYLTQLLNRIPYPWIMNCKCCIMIIDCFHVLHICTVGRLPISILCCHYKITVFEFQRSEFWRYEQLIVRLECKRIFIFPSKSDMYSCIWITITSQ